MIDNTEMVQELLSVVRARKILESVRLWGMDSARCEIYQGIYLQELQGAYKELEPDSTWKQFVVGNCDISYETARRRIRASEWHTVFGADIEELKGIDALKLSVLRDVATDENWREILDDLVAGVSYGDLLVRWKGVPEKDEEPPVARYVHVRCPKCAEEFDAEVSQ